MEHRTLFLTSFHPLISRNILMSGLLTTLAAQRRVIVFVPEHKASYFKEHFSGPLIVVEGVPTKLSRHDLLFRRLILAFTNTRALYIKKRAEFYRDRKLFSFLYSVLPAIVFGRAKPIIQALRAIDYRSAKDNVFNVFFDRYQPDCVFSTDVQNELDVSLLREARKRNIRSVAMVRSWDNLTSKGVLRIIPDTLVVNNEIIRDEAVRYSFVNPKIISVVGIPHYDRYIAARNFLSSSASRQEAAKARETFFRSLHFDTKKKLILFAPFGDRYIRKNELDAYVLEILSEFDLNILVRFPPTDTVNLVNFKNRKAKVEFYRSGNRSWRGGEKLNEVSAEDEDHLIRSLSWTDLVVTGQSTIAVDAMVFDKPVVAVAFDKGPRVYWDSVRRYYDYEYYEKFKKAGGVRFAHSPNELKTLVETYLKNPLRDQEKRRKAAEGQVYSFDGKATEKLANLLLK